MYDILISCFGCILIIILGYLLKRIGILTFEDRKPLSKIITHITLPCAIICGAGNLKLDWQMALIVLLGLSFALLMLFTSYLLTRRCSKEDQVFYLLSCGAFNVSSFTIPFIQTQIAPAYLIIAFAFDAGNALMATNGAYITTCALTGYKRNQGSFFRRLFSSIPFDVYLIILFFSLFHLSVPSVVTDLVSIAARANPFLCMFVIGVMLEFRFEREAIKKTSFILITRLGFAALACLIVRLLPLDTQVIKIICVCLFSPVSTLAPIFIDMIGGDTSLSSFVFSCSTIVSILIITIILL